LPRTANGLLSAVAAVGADEVIPLTGDDQATGAALAVAG
jgi:hypothetical protein